MPAFKSKLEVKKEYSSSLDSAFLYKFEDRDDVVVRSIDWKHFLAKGYFRPDWQEASISAEDFARISKKHFDELSTYGVAVPASFLVADQTRTGVNEEEVFAIVQNVRRSENPDKAALGRAFAALRMSLLAYYKDKSTSGTSFLADLFNDRQYVYGSTEHDPTDHPYLVDVEPFIYRDPKSLRTILGSMLQVVEQERSYFSLPAYDAVCEGFQSLCDAMDKKLANA